MISSRVIIASLVALQSVRAQSPAPKVVPDESSCPRCTVTTRALLTLGADDGVGSLNGRPMSVNVDARGRWWVFQELEPPTVFTSTGAVVGLAGRKGSGPGEFRSANYGIVTGDSMVVFDWQETRATVLGPDMKAHRTIRTGHGLGDVLLLAWPGLLVTSGYFHGANPPNSTIHRLSLAGEAMQVLGSFGPRGVGESMGNAEVHQIIGRARDGIWSAYWNRPHFTRWDRNGVARLSLTRRFDWYTGETRASVGTPTIAPTPMTGAVHEDSEGLVWLFIYTPAPTWKDAWTAPPIRYPGGGTEYPMRKMDFDKLYRTYVEVIDPVQARVIARHTINGYVFEPLPDRRVALYKVDFAGIPRVDIVQLSLNGR